MNRQQLNDDVVEAYNHLTYSMNRWACALVSLIQIALLYAAQRMQLLRRWLTETPRQVDERERVEHGLSAKREVIE